MWTVAWQLLTPVGLFAQNVALVMFTRHLAPRGKPSRHQINSHRWAERQLLLAKLLVGGFLVTLVLGRNIAP